MEHSQLGKTPKLQAHRSQERAQPHLHPTDFLKLAAHPISCDTYEKYYEHLINLIFEKKTIKIDGTLIIEHNKFLNFKNSNYFYMSRKYGDINFSFFKYLKK